MQTMMAIASLLRTLWLLGLCLAPPCAVHASSISNPLRHDGDIGKVVPGYFDVKQKKPFFNMTPNAVHDLPFVGHNHPDPVCSVGFSLAWSTTVGSAVFASPVIFPTGSEGPRQIFLSTFFQTVEALGHDGYKMPGWPLNFEDSTFQGSPMLYDVDGDGKNDVGMVDKNGNLFWVRMGEFGQYLEDYHIQVRKSDGDVHEYDAERGRFCQRRGGRCPLGNAPTDAPVLSPRTTSSTHPSPLPHAHLPGAQAESEARLARQHGPELRRQLRDELDVRPRRVGVRAYVCCLSPCLCRCECRPYALT